MVAVLRKVMVGDMERSRLKEIKALFFVGVNEGNIPKSTQTGGILSELDRDFFQEQGVELAPGPKELMNMQRFYLYLNMTRPANCHRRSQLPDICAAHPKSPGGCHHT